MAQPVEHTLCQAVVHLVEPSAVVRKPRLWPGSERRCSKAHRLHHHIWKKEGTSWTQVHISSPPEQFYLLENHQPSLPHTMTQESQMTKDIRLNKVLSSTTFNHIPSCSPFWLLLFLSFSPDAAPDIYLMHIFQLQPTNLMMYVCVYSTALKDLEQTTFNYYEVCAKGHLSLVFLF